MNDITWFEATNDDGIQTIAFDSLSDRGYDQIVGYNGILKGDKVLYKDKEYTVVMVSRLGHMGLSDTGELPYHICAYPDELKILN